MIAVLTSLELKSPLKFFALSYQALQIMRQLKPTACVKYKSKGFWTLHYTMTLWNSAEDMKAFAKSGAHLDAMKKGASIAKEIRTLVLPAKELPNWNEAKKKLLNEGKVIRYN